MACDLLESSSFKLGGSTPHPPSTLRVVRRPLPHSVGGEVLGLTTSQRSTGAPRQHLAPTEWGRGRRRLAEASRVRGLTLHLTPQLATPGIRIATRPGVPVEQPVYQILVLVPLFPLQRRVDRVARDVDREP